MTIGILLSKGQHPSSGAARASHADLSGLHLALGTGAPVLGIHLGAPCEALRDYGAYGLEALVCLDLPSEGAPLAASTWQRLVAEHRIDLLVAGAQGESPGSRGLLPYYAAHALGWPVVPAVETLQKDGDDWALSARLGPTTRRRHEGTGGAVLLAAPMAVDRMVYAAFRRDRLRIQHVDLSPATGGDQSGCAQDAAAQARMPMPPWNSPNPHDGAAARLATLRGLPGSGQGQLQHPASPEEAARALLAFLEHNGFRLPTH